jgi:hypothetical protein
VCKTRPMFLQEHFHTICTRSKLPHENGEVFLQEHLSMRAAIGRDRSISEPSDWPRVLLHQKMFLQEHCALIDVGWAKSKTA